MKQFLLFAVICSAVLYGCRDSKKAEAAPARPMPLVLIYQKKVIGDPARWPIMKKKDLNNIRINTQEDFVKLFDDPKELYGIKVKEFKPENPRMHGKIFSAVQRIGNIGVYGAFVKVQTFSNGLIRSIEYAFTEEGRKLAGSAKPFPDELKKKLIGGKKGHTVTNAVSLIYDPVLANDKGKPCLVWLVDIREKDLIEVRYFISQQDGKIIYKSHPIIKDLKKAKK